MVPRAWESGIAREFRLCANRIDSIAIGVTQVSPHVDSVLEHISTYWILVPLLEKRAREPPSRWDMPDRFVNVAHHRVGNLNVEESPGACVPVVDPRMPNTNLATSALVDPPISGSGAARLLRMSCLPGHPTPPAPAVLQARFKERSGHVEDSFGPVIHQMTWYLRVLNPAILLVSLRFQCH